MAIERLDQVISINPTVAFVELEVEMRSENANCDYDIQLLRGGSTFVMCTLGASLHLE